MTTLEQAVSTTRRLSPKTRDLYLRRVRSFLGFAQGNWTGASVELWRDHLYSQGLKPKTINTYLSAVKFASKRLHERGEGPNFAYGAERLPTISQAETEPRALTIAECQRLVGTCNGPHPADIRDRALILIGLHAAYRRTEIVTITFDNAQRNIFNARVKGRGRWHAVLVGQEPWQAFLAWKEWLRRRGVDVVSEGSPVFRSVRESVDRGWLIGETALSGNAFYDIIKKRATQAGIGASDIRPHTLRHTFTSIALEAGIPEWRIQKVLGHKSRSTMMAHYAHDLSPDAVGDEFPEIG